MNGSESTQVTAGIWGFIILFALAVACFFIFRSMSTHLRRMRNADAMAAPDEARDSRERAPRQHP